MMKVHYGTITLLGIALNLFVFRPTAAQEAGTVEILADSDAYTDGVGFPSASGPIEVFAHTDVPDVVPGGFGDVACAVENLTDNTTVNVLIEGHVTYYDGRTQTILRRRQPQTLDPGSTLIDFIIFFVPADAVPGLATFLCTASATKVTGTTNHGDYSNPIVDSDHSQFEVAGNITNP